MSGIMDMPDGELKVLVDELTLYAAHKINKLLWRGVQVAPDDVVQDAIKDLLDKKRHWDPQKQPDLKEFLCGVIDSKVNHLVNRHDNAKTHLADPISAERTEVTDELTDDWRPDLRAVQKETTTWFQATVRQAVEGSDPRMKIVLECLQADWDRATIADFLGVDPKEVDAIRKRLQRKLDPLRREYVKRSQS